MGDQENDVTPLSNGGAINSRPIIDMSGDDPGGDDFLDVRPGAEVKQTPAEILAGKKPEENPEGDPQKNEGKADGAPADAGGKDDAAKSALQKLADVIPELAEIEDFKELSLEEGRKKVLAVLNERKEIAQNVAKFEQEKKQIIAMSELMDSDKELAEAVWSMIDRKKNGLPLFPEKIDESKLTPEQRELKARLDKIDNDLKDRKFKEDVAFFNNKITAINQKHKDAKGERLLDDDDIDYIADQAIRLKTDDLETIAEKFVETRNNRINKLIEAKMPELKEKLKPEIIREYIGMKEEDRAKFLKTEQKAPSGGPATPPKRLTLDSEGPKKALAEALRELNRASA